MLQVACILHRGERNPGKKVGNWHNYWNTQAIIKVQLQIKLPFLMLSKYVWCKNIDKGFRTEFSPKHVPGLYGPPFSTVTHPVVPRFDVLDGWLWSLLYEYKSHIGCMFIFKFQPKKLIQRKNRQQFTVQVPGKIRLTVVAEFFPGIFVCNIGIYLVLF